MSLQRTDAAVPGNPASVPTGPVGRRLFDEATGTVSPSSADGEPRFVAEQLLGIGSTGEVYTVLDHDLSRRVAVKVLLPEPSADPDEVRQFVREARLTASLQHPNVLPILDLGITRDGRPCFVMSRIDGVTLGQCIALSSATRREPRIATANALVSLFIAVCNAVAYAHHRGIVHQDIKPENILLGEFGEVLVLDWGSARHSGGGTVGDLQGTPIYMSPEQARREGADALSDVYCIGAALFHALTLRPPTWSDNPVEFWRKKKAGEIDPPTAEERAAAPQPLLHIVLKALAAAAADRYASVEALLADLQAFQAGLAVSAFPEPPWLRLRRWYLRHRAACWAGAATTFVIGCLGLALAAERAKQSSSWRLVADEDFANATPGDLEKRWVGRVKTADSGQGPFHEEPLAGSEHWRLGEGKLTLASENDYADLAWRGGLGGDFRVVWDYTPERNALSLDCFIGPERESGYTFHVGNADPREVMLSRGPGICDERLLDEPLRVGRTYAFALERQGTRLRLEIDGRCIFDYVETDPLKAVRADAFGFDCYRGQRQSIRRVRIFQRPLPELVSPLMVAQKAFQCGDAEEAARCYAEIERVHPGAAIAVTARGLQGLCLMRAATREQGASLLNAFVVEHAGHELVPLALVELEAYACERHDSGEVARLRSELTHWRGHPALRRVLQEIADGYQPLLAAQRVVAVGGNPYPEDDGEALTAAAAEVRHWADAYGVAGAGVDFLRKGAVKLARLGRFDDAMACCPPGTNEEAQLLMMSGDFQGALDRFGYNPELRGKALLELGRYEDVVADAELQDDDRATALIALGRPDEALTRYPRSAAASSLLIASGKLEEFAALFAGHEHEGMPWFTPEYRLLSARHDWEAILARYADPISRGEALLKLGRYDEALQAYADQDWAPYKVVFRLLRRGERERALDIVQRMAVHRPMNGGPAISGYGVLFHALLPALVQGGPIDPRSALRGILAGDRRWFGQRLWHLAAVIAGVEDEAAFRVQPRRAVLDQDLQLARAMRSDCLGLRVEANAAYGAIGAMSGLGSDLVREFIDWRVQSLAAAPPR